MANDTQAGLPEQEDIHLSEKFYEDLTEGARLYFNATVTEYTEKLLNEATNIEKIEHAGEGSAEITAAHVEEAKWVLLRRLRRSVGRSGWVVTIRVSQTIMAGMVGVGASNFKEIWGAVMCVIGIFVGSIMLIVEREITREL